MDSEKFDDLIKRIGTARVSRLTALKGLVGGAAVALTGAAVATSDADAKNKKKGKSKKKGKKKSRNSQAVAPIYDNGPAPAPIHKPADDTKTPSNNTSPAPVCDKYEDCGYDARWDDKECRCVCKQDYYEWCEYGDYASTCVDSKCDEYSEYDWKTCSCVEVCYPPYDDFCGYGEWDYDKCACSCEGDYYELCEYGDYAGTCVDTKCGDYLSYDKKSCSCFCEADDYTRNSCEYGYEWSDYDCKCIRLVD
jgi:hypothetical protein